jgi:nucleoside diphosphate kinase
MLVPNTASGTSNFGQDCRAIKAEYSARIAETIIREVDAPRDANHGFPVGAQTAILMLKPDGMREHIGEQDLCSFIRNVLTQLNLAVRTEVVTELNSTDVNEIYNDLSIPDLVYGEGWKQRFIDHLTSAPVKVFLIEGADACSVPPTRDRFQRLNPTNPTPL